MEQGTHRDVKRQRQGLGHNKAISQVYIDGGDKSVGENQQYFYSLRNPASALR